MVQTFSSTIADLNQKTYQRLKSALELNLRRQIFIAVCDNLVLRDRLVTELEDDLSGYGAHRHAPARQRSYPQFVTLKLDLSNPDPINQIAHWLRRSPPPINRRNQSVMPAFQLVGIEQLSRQPASMQWVFLNHLRSIEHSLPVLESSILLWVTRPWSRMIPQSAPDFWRCRTAVFDFMGEPTPLVSLPETFPMVSQASSNISTQAGTSISTPASHTHSRTSHAASMNGIRADASGDRPVHTIPLTDTAPDLEPDLENDAIPTLPLTDEPLSIDQDKTLLINDTHVQQDAVQSDDIEHIEVSDDVGASVDPPTGLHHDVAERDSVQDTHTPNVPDSTFEQGAIADETASNEWFQEIDAVTADVISNADHEDIAVTNGALPDALQREQVPLVFDDQEPLILDDQDVDVQTTLHDLINGESLDTPTGSSADDSISDTFDTKALQIFNELPDEDTPALADSLEPSLDDQNQISPSLAASEPSADPDLLTDAELLQMFDGLDSENPTSEHDPSADQASRNSPSENLGFGDTFNDPWLTQSNTDALEELFEQSHEEESALQLSVPDEPETSDDFGNVTDVLIPSEIDADSIADDVDVSDANLEDDVSILDADILVPFEADSISIHDADVDDEIQVLDAEPNFLNASLSSDPGLGFSTVGQTPAQRSWLESSIAEAAQADLAVDDPQAHVLVEQLERLRQQQAPKNVVAGAYRGLGNLYRDRIEQGDVSPKNLVRAMKAYEEVLKLVSDDSPTWSEVLNDMGNLCWLLSRCAPSPEQGLPHLQQGIQAYRMALTKINPSTHPQTYPMIQNNLGAAYGDLARYHNPFDNLQQSVQAYQEALRYRKAEADPMRFASTQNNLGTTYWNLAQYRDPIKNLKRATDAYSQALGYYQPDKDALNYAMIQNNLGTAFWNLAQHERSERWLSAAIDAYTIALKYRTLEANPVAYAATQNNLGTAYWHISEYYEEQATERIDFLRHAVHSYGEALDAATLIQRSHQASALNFDVFATRNNFGLVQYQLATDKKFVSQNDHESMFLENALDQHLAALQGWQGRPELRQTAMQCVIQVLKAIYLQKGLVGQNLALSKIPGQLLPEILPQL
ncbi:MAG: hypothetical protein AAF327_01740 [Cyanobacteria bacterium P01_A01_bin.37]